MGATPTSPGAPAHWWRRTVWVRRGVTVSGLVALGLLAWYNSRAPVLPDFKTAGTTGAKKAAFFAYLLPRVREVNADIMEQRRRLLQVRQALAAGNAPGLLTRHWLAGLAEEYEMDAPKGYSLNFLDGLLRRVDVVAPSLVLAQAAYESAWGTSRFARQGNNLFGLRSYDDVDGMVPRRRESGQKFTLATFDSVRAGIAAYVHNLNTGVQYRELRQIRDTLRQQKKPVSGQALVNGLDAYSELGVEYIATIRALIRDNNLEQYDAPK